MISTIDKSALMYCDSRNIIVFKENKSTYIANNSTNKIVEAYRIDGVLIVNGTRCDYGLADPCTNVLYLIELKGSDLCHACEQISSTIKFLEDRNLKVPFFARIVLSKASGPDLESMQYKKLSRQIRNRGGNLKQKNIVFEEEI